MKDKLNINNLKITLSKKEVEDMIVEYLKKTKGLDVSNRKIFVMPNLINTVEDRFSDSPVKFKDITVTVENFKMS